LSCRSGSTRPLHGARAAEKTESATFRLAVPRPGSDNADFLDIVTFDKLAATCGETSRRPTDEPDGGVADEPADKPAVGAYRRKAS
jgi:hypothetical protein